MRELLKSDSICESYAQICHALVNKVVCVCVCVKKDPVFFDSQCSYMLRQRECREDEMLLGISLRQETSYDRQCAAMAALIHARS